MAKEYSAAVTTATASAAAPSKQSAEKRDQRTPPTPEKRPRSSSDKAAKTQRLASLDAFRGAIMLLLASNALGLAALAHRMPNTIWATLGSQFAHVPWQGCSIWDMIQPAFMFMVGVSLPYSYANRRARGDSYLKTLLHAALRSLVLVLLGVFLASQHPWMSTNFFFTNVLAQIGLGYLFVFLLVDRWPWLQALVIVAILGGYGYLFYRHPLPEPNFDYAAVGIKPEDVLPGTAGHWTKNINFAADFDRKFLNWFPRPEPYEFTEGGYQTLNFIPSIVTMILGLMAGELLRSSRPDKTKLIWLVGGGAVCLAAGLVLHFVVGVPIVKRIWTPSWALASGGGTLWLLAAFYWVIDVRGWQRWAFPLVVVGMNSMLMYLMNQLSREWFAHHWRVHFGQTIFEGDLGPVVQSLAVALTMWLICYWLYRQRVFLKI